MRGGQSIYRLHTEPAKQPGSRQPKPELPGQKPNPALARFMSRRARLPGQARLEQPTLPGLPGQRKPAPQKPPELGTNEQGMPCAY